jgi:SAM-dependent methyltransferase
MSAHPAARRADWRFLLPDPSPARVACVGPRDPALERALELSGAVVDAPGGPAACDGHELVVVTSRRPAAVAEACRVLRPGGWLYAETPGFRLRRWQRALRAAGLDEVAAHWLWPDEQSCREIAPLEASALRHALGRRDPGAALRLRARLAGLLVRAGLFRFAVRRAAVIGRRPP